MPLQVFPQSQLSFIVLDNPCGRHEWDVPASKVTTYFVRVGTHYIPFTRTIIRSEHTLFNILSDRCAHTTTFHGGSYVR